MGRPKKLVPEYRLHQPGNLAKVWWDGSWVYLGKFNSKESLDEYRDLLSSIKPEKGALTITDQLLVSGLVAKYIEHHKINGPSQDQIYKMKVVGRALITHAGTVPANHFGPLLAIQIRQDWVKRRLGISTVTHYFNKLKDVFAWGVSRELVRAEVVTALNTIKNVRPSATGVRPSLKRQPVSRKLLRQSLPHLPINIRKVVMVLYLTGARPAEILKLRAQDIDRSVNPWVYRVAIHKNTHKGQDRTIFFGRGSQRLLKPLLDENRDYLFPGGEVETIRQKERTANRKRPSLYKRKGRKFKSCYCSNSFYLLIRNILKREGLPAWYPYQLRHSAATRMQRKADILAAKAVLGHRSATITAGYLPQEEREDQPLHRTMAAKWG